MLTLNKKINLLMLCTIGFNILCLILTIVLREDFSKLFTNVPNYVMWTLVGAILLGFALAGFYAYFLGLRAGKSPTIQIMSVPDFGDVIKYLSNLHGETYRTAVKDCLDYMRNNT